MKENEVSKIESGGVGGGKPGNASALLLQRELSIENREGVPLFSLRSSQETASGRHHQEKCHGVQRRAR